MSYNGSGTFQINTTGQPVVTGTVISSTAFNALTADLATGLSTAITKDGQTATTARIPFAAGISSTLVTDSSSTSTGSIITAGGIGVAKAAYIGTTLNVASTTTLTGVATLTANPVLSAGTANGVTYLNGSKSLTSSSALTFDGTNFSTTGTASATKLIPTGTSVTGNGLYLPATNALGLSTNGTNAVYIDASQNVGIGGAPTQKLDVYGGAGAAVSIVRAASGQNAFFSVAGNGNTFLSTSFDIVQDSSNLASIVQRANAALAISTNNTERMRIDSSGRLLINSTSDVGANNPAFSANAGASSFSNIMEARWTGTTSIYHLLVRNGNGLIGGVTSSGSTTSFVTSSDYRLKDNITPMIGALAKVSALKPVTYKWKIDDTEGEGFIAHELAEVCPIAVHGEKDALNEDGSIKSQSIDTSFLVATLTAAIQEQQALITALTARITALEAK
jgi:hypothetical protein